MERDLSGVSDRTPVVIFVHDQPDAEAKHFRNPNPPHNINAVDQFENLLADTLEDGRTITVQSIAYDVFCSGTAALPDGQWPPSGTSRPSRSFARRAYRSPRLESRSTRHTSPKPPAF